MTAHAGVIESGFGYAPRMTAGWRGMDVNAYRLTTICIITGVERSARGVETLVTKTHAVEWKHR